MIHGAGRLRAAPRHRERTLDERNFDAWARSRHLEPDLVLRDAYRAGQDAAEQRSTMAQALFALGVIALALAFTAWLIAWFA